MQPLFPPGLFHYTVWILGLFSVWLVICLSNYFPNDGDGTLYAQLAARLASENFEELFAIEWYEFNRIYGPTASESRYFYEHPPGFFLLPWLLAQAGLPALKVTLLSETLYQLTFLWMTYQLLNRLYGSVKASWSILLVLIMPVSFWYVLRPVHEMPMLAALIAMILTITFYDQRPVWSVIGLFLIGSFAGLMKGIMILPLVAVAALSGFFLIARKRVLLGSLLCSCGFGGGSFASLTAFEKYRLSSIGDTFWLPYIKIQFWGRALENSTPGDIAYRTMEHSAVYLSALVFYALPWSIVAILAAYRGLKGGYFQKPNTASLQVLFLISALVLTLPLTVFARWSVRYIFPAYYLVALVGILQTISYLDSRLTLNDKPFYSLGANLHKRDSMILAAGVWTISKVAAIAFATK